MYDETILTGHVSSYDDPEWGPLERFLPLELCGPFMWMDAWTLEDGRRLEAYKHSCTRRYLHLDENGDAWEYLDAGRFRRKRHDEAIEQVFDTWWVLTHSTDAEREALKAAFEAAHERGNGDEGAGAHILPSSPACAMRWLPLEAGDGAGRS